MPSEFTILIVEDDRTIASLVQGSLRRWGFAVSCVEDFADVMGAFRACAPHLVLLDISLPYFNGYYWCGEIRKESKAPILFLSSHTQSMDIVMAVNMGGDDYVTKPFSMDVLLAKINALLRRAYAYDGAEAPALTLGGAALSTADGTLSLDGRRLELTRNESRILTLLLQRKGAVVTREALMRALWEDEHFIDENTLTVNINRLRKKLASFGLGDAVRTKKGEGYVIRD